MSPSNHRNRISRRPTCCLSSFVSSTFQSVSISHSYFVCRASPTIPLFTPFLLFCLFSVNRVRNGIQLPHGSDRRRTARWTTSAELHAYDQTGRHAIGELRSGSTTISHFSLHFSSHTSHSYIALGCL